MALIKCPECGKEISDKANICVNCGFPIQDYLIEQEKEIKEQNEIVKESKIDVCPFCDSDNIDNYGYCNDCGMRISSYKDNISKTEIEEVSDDECYTICPECGKKNKTGVFICNYCKHVYKLLEYNVLVPEKPLEDDFNGIYRRTLHNRLEKVYCPICGSENCSHYQEQKIVPEKIKTTYLLNLNPFRPFTLVNENKKIKRKEQVVTECKFLCNRCGKIFK